MGKRCVSEGWESKESISKIRSSKDGYTTAIAEGYASVHTKFAADILENLCAYWRMGPWAWVVQRVGCYELAGGKCCWALDVFYVMILFGTLYFSGRQRIFAPALFMQRDYAGLCYTKATHEEQRKKTKVHVKNRLMNQDGMKDISSEAFFEKRRCRDCEVLG